MTPWAEMSVKERSELVRSYIMELGWSYLRVSEHLQVSRSTIAGVCYRANIKAVPKEASTIQVASSPEPPAKPALRIVSSQPPTFRAGLGYMTRKVFRPPTPPTPPSTAPRSLLHGDKWLPLPGTTPVAFLDAAQTQCKWMVGHHLCCGQTVKAGKPYCPTHYAVAYLPPAPKKVRRG